MAGTFNVNARAGFMPFDLSELHDLYTNLKDGNFWSAFKRAVRLLDDIINPAAGKTLARSWDADVGDRIDDCCQGLEEWCEEQSESHPAEASRPMRRAGEPNVDAVDPASIITIVTLILQFVAEWRKRRKPAAGMAETNRQRSERLESTSPREAIMKDPQSRNPDGSINRPAGVTSDQPAPAATDPSDPSGKPLDVTNDTNSKEDTLAGKQTQFPADMNRATNARDAAPTDESEEPAQEANANEAGPNRDNVNSGPDGQSDAMKRAAQAKQDAAKAAEAAKPKPGHKPGSGKRG